MSWDEVVKLLGITIDKRESWHGIRYDVWIKKFNKHGAYSYSNDFANTCNVPIDSIIKNKILWDFELQKWLNTKITFDDKLEGYTAFDKPWENR